jgi:hypothetical protein
LLTKRRTIVFVIVALLLFAAFLRLQHLVSFVEWPDEIRSVWRTQFGLDNLLIRNPPDWPPLYEVFVWVWIRIAGRALEVSRYTSVLFSLLGASLTYRAAFRLTQSLAASLISALAYAVLGYLIFSGVDVRAYGLLMALGALAFWELLRWLDRPSWRRGIGLAVTLAVMFYTSFASTAFIAFLTLYALVMKPRRFHYWIGIGVGVLILCLPILPQFLQNGTARVSNRLVQGLLPLGRAIIQVFHDFGGSDWFLIPFTIAVLLIIWRAVQRPAECRRIVLFVVWLMFPIAVYIVTKNREFMKPRYMYWVALGIALMMGYAVLQVPPRVRLAVPVIFIALSCIPVDFNIYRLAETTAPPFRETFAWFAKNIRPDDVLVIDPKCTCGDKFGWDYFVPQYFPTGYLPIVAHPGNASRVWYLSNPGWPRDEKLLAEVQQGRKESIFYGPWFFLLRLYEGPPSWTGTAFGGKVRFNGGEIDGNNTILAKDERFQVNLWWSADQPPDRDYSISVAVVDTAGRLITQADGPIKIDDEPLQTSAWQPGQYYQDVRDLHLPPNLKDGNYSLVVTVYQWWDNVRLLPEENTLWSRAGGDSSYLVIQHIEVVS